LSRRAFVAHGVIMVWVPGCIFAAWWQASVAMAGNGLSYLYAVEWPIFAIFGIVLWWNVIHDDPETHGNRRLASLRKVQRDSPEPPPTPSMVRRQSQEDEQLRAYNDYLEQLAQKNQPKTWRAE